MPSIDGWKTHIDRFCPFGLTRPSANANVQLLFFLNLHYTPCLYVYRFSPLFQVGRLSPNWPSKNLVHQPHGTAKQGSTAKNQWSGYFPPCRCICSLNNSLPDGIFRRLAYNFLNPTHIGLEEPYDCSKQFHYQNRTRYVKSALSALF